MGSRRNQQQQQQFFLVERLHELLKYFVVCTFVSWSRKRCRRPDTWVIIRRAIQTCNF